MAAQRHAWSSSKVLRIGLWVDVCTRDGCTATRRRIQPSGVTVYQTTGTTWSKTAPPCVLASAPDQLELGVGGRR